MENVQDKYYPFKSEKDFNKFLIGDESAEFVDGVESLDECYNTHCANE